MSSTARRIIRSGLWLWLSSVANNLGGFIFWFIVSLLAGPAALGRVSAILALSTIASSILSLGVNNGLLRFYGMSVTRDRRALSSYFWSTLLLVTATHGAAAALLLAAALSGRSLGPYTPSLLLYAAPILLALGVLNVVEPLVVSSLNTIVRFAAALAGNLAKIALGTVLILLGLEWRGAALALLTQFAIMVVVEGYAALGMVERRFVIDTSRLSEVVKAGLASWLPATIELVGRWLGVVTVFASLGASETGYYYVAYALTQFASMLPLSLINLVLPVLARGDSRDESMLVNKVLRVSTLLAAPIVAFMLAYPEYILALLGERYKQASLQLAILAASIPFTSLYTLIQNMAYAEGAYRTVMLIGLGVNVPRLLLYYALTPVYGGLGTAIAYTAGCMTGLAAALVASRLRSYNVDVLRPVLAYTTTAAAVLALRMCSQSVLAAVALLAVITGLYPLAGIITVEDVRDVLQAVLGEERSQRIYSLLRMLASVLSGSRR